MVDHSTELGCGAFANVYMATVLRRKYDCLSMGAGKSLKRKVAAKVCKETDDPDRYAPQNLYQTDYRATSSDDAMREVEVMRALGQHRHIVQLIGYTQVNDGDVTIVLEYCEKGNLLNYLRKEVRQNMELASKVRMWVVKEDLFCYRGGNFRVGGKMTKNFRGGESLNKHLGLGKSSKTFKRTQNVV